MDLNQVFRWLDERYQLIDAEMDRAFRLYRAAFDAHANVERLLYETRTTIKERVSNLGRSDEVPPDGGSG